MPGAKKMGRTDPIPFGDRLVLFRYFLHLFGKSSLAALAGKMNSAEYEGYNEDRNTWFYVELDRLCVVGARRRDGVKISRDKLRLYDENICRHIRQIGAHRGEVTLKYFQYMALLFTEYYLDRYFSDRAAFAEELNAFAAECAAESPSRDFYPAYRYTPDNMGRLSYMCATGSGKTLLMHVNILQFGHYLKRAQALDSHLVINKTIVLAPDEDMSAQHLDELALSSIPATLFEKDPTLSAQRVPVVVIDMGKLREEGRVKTVSIDSFEGNNLVLVDESHYGLSGDVWHDYRSRLSAEGGFAFEYSATFKQALKKLGAEKSEPLRDAYCMSIIMDYSYKYFYADGYGKEYRIYNLREGFDREQQALYLTGCLLSFYQQLKLFDVYHTSYAPFQIEKPLLVFVGTRVTATPSATELTDIEEVLGFIDDFASDRKRSIERIGAVLTGRTGLTNSRGNPLFAKDFDALKLLFGGQAHPAEVFTDVLRLVFLSTTAADSPRLYLSDLRQVPGEIALQLGPEGKYFGLINIGDTAKLLKHCAERGIVTRSDEFSRVSLFRSIGAADSPIQMLIGSRKFIQGWNSWRVSTMGLINFAKGEGPQAIQIFGRGVRLRGYKGRLKRSRRLDDNDVQIPKYIELLETLTVFGVRAQYMEDFIEYLELEDLSTGEDRHEFYLPTQSRLEAAARSELQVLAVQGGADFKRRSPRLLLDVPDTAFYHHLVRHKIVVDCRSKVQEISSRSTVQEEIPATEQILSEVYLQNLDYNRVYEELRQYKQAKGYSNIVIDPGKLSEILSTPGWYALILPHVHLETPSVETLLSAADYAALVLQRYMDKFYRFRKAAWEEPLLCYTPLEADNRNLIEGHRISYTELSPEDQGAELLATRLERCAKARPKSRGALRETALYQQSLVALDCPFHLYTPLLFAGREATHISVSPVALNEGERLFLSKLSDYIDGHSAELSHVRVHLLRNQSSSGMGFFEIDYFYPDFVLWLVTHNTQYITYIDPKGLGRVGFDDPKILFCQKIKELEKLLAARASDRHIVLNSFILSVTPSAELEIFWNKTKPEREARHVLCLDSDDCIEVMISKILGLSPSS